MIVAGLIGGVIGGMVGAFVTLLVLGLCQAAAGKMDRVGDEWPGEPP